MRAVDERSQEEVHTVVLLNCKTCPAFGCLGRVVAAWTVIRVRTGMKVKGTGKYVFSDADPYDEVKWKCLCLFGRLSLNSLAL